MGLQKQYLKYGQTARDKIFGLPPDTRRNGPTPLSMLISHGAKFNNSKYRDNSNVWFFCLFQFSVHFAHCHLNWWEVENRRKKARVSSQPCKNWRVVEIQRWATFNAPNTHSADFSCTFIHILAPTLMTSIARLHVYTFVAFCVCERALCVSSIKSAFAAK